MTTNATPSIKDPAQERVPADFADKLALIVLLALDAAHRGQANTSQSNTLFLHLGTAHLLWHHRGSGPMIRRALDAMTAMGRAARRDQDKPVALKPSEYQTIRIAIGYYLNSLTTFKVGELVEASKLSAESMGAAPVLAYAKAA